VRLAELIAMISLGTDLGMGQPMDHVMRASLIALRLAERLGLDETARGVVYYVGLLGWVGCHVDAYEQAKWFGDDRALKADARGVDMAGGRPGVRLEPCRRRSGIGGAGAPGGQVRRRGSPCRYGSPDANDTRTSAALAQEHYYSSYRDPESLTLPRPSAPSDQTPWPAIAASIAIALASVATTATQVRARLCARRAATLRCDQASA
jgi:hypothetical protein